VQKKIRADRVSYNGFTYYSGVVSGKELLQSSFVSRRDDDPKAGFNRALVAPRAREIARYLDTEQSTIPSNIVLSAQTNAKLTYARGSLSWTVGPDSFLVLDGQHRLFSMEHVDVDYPFAVAIFDGLSPQQEVRLFIDINTKQKGVPAALLLDIKQLAGTETSIEAQLRSLFDAVSTDPTSPLKGQLSPAAKKAGQISRVTFNNAVKKPLESGVLNQVSDEDDRARLVINYLTAARRTIQQSGAVHNNLTKATILQAFFEVFNEVVDQTLARDGVLRADNMSETMQPLSALDFDAYIGSNRPSKAKLVTDMRGHLSPNLAVTSEML